MATTKRNGRVFIHEGFTFIRTSKISKDGEETPPQPKSQYRLINQNIETVIQDYANRNLEDYLRGIAYNLHRF